MVRVKKSKTSKERPLKSYPNGAELLREEASNIFRALREKTPTEVAYQFGLDRFYSTEASMRSGIYRAYQTVLSDPQAYGISIESARQVQEIVKSRAITPARIYALSRREQAEIEKAQMIELVTSGRDKAFRLLHHKLDDLGRKGAEYKKAKLMDIAKVAGILFDKGQVLRGEATQNIAILSKNISSDMTAEDALKAVITMQEKIAAQKES